MHATRLLPGRPGPPLTPSWHLPLWRSPRSQRGLQSVTSPSCRDTHACRTSDVCPAHRHEAWTPGLRATPCRMTAAGPGRLLPEPRMMPVRLCPRVFTDRGQRGRSVVLPRETAHPKVPRKCRLGPPGPRALCGGPRHRAGEEDRAQGPAWLPRGRPAPHRTQRWSASWSEPEGA